MFLSFNESGNEKHFRLMWFSNNVDAAADEENQSNILFLYYFCYSINVSIGMQAKLQACDWKFHQCSYGKSMLKNILAKLCLRLSCCFHVFSARSLQTPHVDFWCCIQKFCRSGGFVWGTFTFCIRLSQVRNYERKWSQIKNEKPSKYHRSLSKKTK